MILSRRINQNPRPSIARTKDPKNLKQKWRWLYSAFQIFLLILCVLAFAFHRVQQADPTNAVIQTEGIDDLKEQKSQEQEAKKKTELKEHKDASVEKCALEGSMDPPAEYIVIDFSKINGMDKDPLERVKNYTTENYMKFLLSSAGREHYPFQNYMSATYGDCRHFMDIGTRYVTSALALGSNQKSPVWTFDLPTSSERRASFRGKTEEEWQTQVRELGVDITFYNLDLMRIPDDELKTYFGTWFVMLDTEHLPYTVPFERELFQRMLDIHFKGILVLDDINLNNQMKKWWKELQDNAEKGGYKTFDVTKVGHFSGTGLVDFSGKVIIKE